MEKLEDKDFSSLDWRPTRAVDLRFWASALTSLDDSIKSTLADYPWLLSSHPKPTHGLLSSLAAEKFLAKCLTFFKSLLDMGFFRQYSFVGSLVQLLRCRNAELVVLTLEVFQSLTGNSEWQFEHRIVFRRRTPAPYASKTSGESEKDWNMEEYREKFEFLVEWANLPLGGEVLLGEDGGGEEECNKQLDLALNDFELAESTMQGFDYKSAPFWLHKLRVGRSRKFGLRVQMLLFCLFAPSRTFRKRVRVNLEDAFRLVFDPALQPEMRNSDLVAASKVIRTELATTHSTSSVFSVLISPFTGRGCLVEGIKELLKDACAGPEMRLGLSFARVAMRTNSEQFLLRLETLLVLATTCLSKNPVEGFQTLVNGGVYESLFAWVTASLQSAGEEALILSEEEYFALAAALQLFETFANGEEHPKETEVLIAACHGLVQPQRSPLTFAQKNTTCCLLSLLCNGVGICVDSPICKQVLMTVLQFPQLVGGCVVLSACELIHECEDKKPLAADLVAELIQFVTEGFTQVQEYESILAVIKFLLPSLGSEINVEMFFRRFFSLYHVDSTWYGALFFGSTSIGQHLSIYFSQHATSAMGLCSVLMQEWAKPLPPIGMFLSVRLLGELCHSHDFARVFLKENGLPLLLHRTQDRSSTVVKIIQNVSLNCRKEVFDALCAFVVGEEDDFLCEMLVLVLSSNGNRNTPTRVLASLVSGETCFQALDHLSEWERTQTLPNRHYSRLLHILPSFSAPPPPVSLRSPQPQRPTDLSKLMESFALCLEVVLVAPKSSLNNGDGSMVVDLERMLCRAHKLLRREKSGGVFLSRLSAFGSLELLIQYACVGLTTRQDLAPTCLSLLQFLTEKKAGETSPEQAMHQTLLGMILDQLHLGLGQTTFQLQDSLLCDLVQFFMSRYVQTPFRAAKSTTSVTTASTVAFSPNRQVVLSLYDMGFHGRDVQFAQSFLETNDAGNITAYLLANPRPPVTEEEELEFAMWLSMEDDEEVEVPPVPVQEPVDKVLLVKHQLVKACKRLTLDRAVVPMILSPHPPSPTNTRSPLESVNTIVYFVNLTTEPVLIRSPRGQETICHPNGQELELATFVGNVLTVVRQVGEQKKGEVLGYLSCPFASAKVTLTSLEGTQVIPLVGDSTEFETNHIHVRRLVSFQRDPITTVAVVNVRIVNSSPNRVVFYHMFPFSHWRDGVLDASFAVEAKSELIISRRRNSVWAGQFLPTAEPVGFLLVPNQSIKELVVSIPAGPAGAVPKLSTLCMSMSQLLVPNWEEEAFEHNPLCLLVAMQSQRRGSHIELCNRVHTTLLMQLTSKKRKSMEDEVMNNRQVWDCPLRAKSLVLLDQLGTEGGYGELVNALVSHFDELNIWELEASFAMWADRKIRPLLLSQLLPKVLVASSVSGVRCIQQLVEQPFDLKAHQQDMAYRTFRSFDSRRIPLETFSLRLGNHVGGMLNSMNEFFDCVKDQLEFQRTGNLVVVTGCRKPLTVTYLPEDKQMEELLDLLQEYGTVNDITFCLDVLCKSIFRVVLHVAKRYELILLLVRGFCFPKSLAVVGTLGEFITREDGIVHLLKQLAFCEDDDVKRALLDCIIPLIVDQGNSRIGLLLLLLLNRNGKLLILCETHYKLSALVFTKLRETSMNKEDARSEIERGEDDQDTWLFLFEYLSSRASREILLAAAASSIGGESLGSKVYESNLAWRDELRELDHLHPDSAALEDHHRFMSRVSSSHNHGWEIPAGAFSPFPSLSTPAWGGGDAGVGRFILAPGGGSGTVGGNADHDVFEGGMGNRHYRQPLLMRYGRNPPMGRIGARAMFEQEGANARHEALRDLVTAQLDAVSFAAAAAAVEEIPPCVASPPPTVAATINDDAAINDDATNDTNEEQAAHF
ncbi:hypothetical protein BASA81_008116 [Batrachochytrium salamandrivorans]|nr:hypothetical protein BASA81_008116 [Batrachochytrium salamandrivorans]